MTADDWAVVKEALNPDFHLGAPGRAALARLREREAQLVAERNEWEVTARAESDGLMQWHAAAEAAEARVAQLERDIEDWKAQAHVWNALEAQDRVARLEEALRVIAEGGYGDASIKARRALAHEEEA